MNKTYECGKMIKQIYDELEKQANTTLSSQNLTLTQMRVLMELDNIPQHQLSLKTLESLLHVAQSTTAGIIKRLEQKGYVQSLTDIHDKRVKLVKITEAGTQCCHNAHSHIQNMESQILSNLTQTERKQFWELLQKICNK